jgi:hypothetical protein
VADLDGVRLDAHSRFPGCGTYSSERQLQGAPRSQQHPRMKEGWPCCLLL